MLSGLDLRPRSLEVRKEVEICFEIFSNTLFDSALLIRALHLALALLAACFGAKKLEAVLF